MRNVLDKICRENQNAIYVHHFFSENCVLYNVEKRGGAREAAMTIWSMRVACQLSKVTRATACAHTLMQKHTHMEYVILIVSAEQQCFKAPQR